MNNLKPSERITGIYAITTQYQATPSWYQRIELALQLGIDLLQFRSKQLEDEHRYLIASQLAELCQSYNTPLIINDDIALARAVHAQGVHLGQDDGSIAQAKEQLGEQAIIGRTCHADLALALQAQDEGASYVAFGQVYPSQSKVSAHRASLEFLEQARQKITIPIVAIGGITTLNARDVIDTGVDSLALINGVWAGDLTKNLQALRKAWLSE